MFGFFDPLYLIMIVPVLIFGFWAQHRVSSTFERFSKVPSATGMTGAEMARRILDGNGLSDVEVRAVPGSLSDHYDPRTRTVNLSEPVFSARSVAAVSVAAHETGHALQHKANYVPMTARSALVPLANLGSRAFMPLFWIGFALMIFSRSSGGGVGLLVIQFAILLFSLTVLFQVVTLPVEFNASSRAKKEIVKAGLVPQADMAGTSRVLGAAALTYVAAAAMGIVQLLYFVLRYMGSNR